MGDILAAVRNLGRLHLRDGVGAVLSLLALLFAIPQIMLGESPWAFWISVVAILVAIGIYTSALVGQGLSADESDRIRSDLDECLREAGEDRDSDSPGSIIQGRAALSRSRL
ncbi:MAG TPA: hypothetical protein EYG46_05435 [Myxococcales bacterium]|nr:hypothetical protein [Myxococcales bacterium]HIM00422.1 hypothetical protein [Myxococcales bacterium]